MTDIRVFADGEWRDMWVGEGMPVEFLWCPQGGGTPPSKCTQVRDAVLSDDGTGRVVRAAYETVGGLFGGRLVHRSVVLMRRVRGGGHGEPPLFRLDSHVFGLRIG